MHQEPAPESPRLPVDPAATSESAAEPRHARIYEAPDSQAPHAVGGDPFGAVAPPLAPAIPPPPPPLPKVQEVIALPMSTSDARTPVIEAPPPSATTPPPSSTGGATTGPSTATSSAPPPPPSAPTPPSPKPPSAWQRTKQHIWAVICHLLLLLAIPTAFLGISITFLIWQLKGRKDPHVEDQGREALNFQINVAALTYLASVSCFAAPLVPLLWLVGVIMSIIAAQHASRGEMYRYPWVWRVVSH